MISKDEACKKIASLVERFTEQKEFYKRSDYNETLTRRDFIDPFFKALGWDVDNEQGYAESYREVIHEDKIKIGGATKAPDYSFRLSGGKRLFFVEAKKPSVVIKDEVLPAYQVRRYGWSAKLPISIITDFEEFAIYDCTKKPNLTDKASHARIKYFTYQQYLNEFDFIWDTFSKEKVLKGSFDKFIQNDKQKRGTATVDREFLASLDTWRTQLAANIALRNNIDEDELNFVVQHIIDRIIFLRIAEDRSVEPYGNLQGTIKNGDYYQNLLQQFHTADQKYNSGIFDFGKDNVSGNIAIDNKTIKSIIADLYYPQSPYEFSVISVEILGSAYEQFLGKTISLSKNGKTVIEEKPEVRKAGGVYYTPQYIVEYIVKNTVGKLIENKAPKDISKLKIVDPACGSGSFLIGAYQYLLQYHKDHYTKNGKPSKGSKDNPLTPDGNLTTAEKKRILLNNIFGVDLDANAVEVTKLSLLLKCMEGETEASIATQLMLFHERILPTLDNNIKSGNSLIDIDFYGSQIDFGEERKVKPFSWKNTFPEVFKQGGFDCVIGNPPYVRQELLGIQKSYFQKKYKVYHGMADLYSYFFEKGIGLLKEKGLFGIIVANKWMRANYGEPLRKWLKEWQIQEIIDFGDLPVFEGATTYPCIIICKNQKASDAFRLVNAKTLQFESLEKYVSETGLSMYPYSLDDAGWNLAGETEQALLKKLKAAGIPLGKYVEGKIFRGVLTGLNEAFVIDGATKQRLINEDEKSAEIIKPFLAGKDIKRYQSPKSNRFLIFTKRGINIDKYPAIKKHLELFKKQLTPKPKDFKGEVWEGRKQGSYKWYEIQDAVDYYEEFEKPKILWPGISYEVASFAFDEKNYYGNDNNQLIVSSDKYLLGILNSNLLKFQLKNICDKVQGGFYRLKIIYVKQLSIKIIDENNKIEIKFKDEIINLVSQLLQLNEEKQQATLQSKTEQIQNRIAYCEGRINEIVYQLYGLTAEEIALVEGA